MTEKVTIIITTYKRIDKLKECIESIEKYTDPELYKILIGIDNNDNKTGVFLYPYTDPLNDKCSFKISNNQKDWVGLTNGLIKECKTEHFVFICDDWLCVEHGWLNKGMAAFKNAFPDDCGLLIFNDYIQENYPNKVRPIKLCSGDEIKMATHGLSSKTFVKFLGGELLHSGYRHYSADCELAIKAHLEGKYYYLHDVILKHNHYIHTGIRDEIYDDSEKKNFIRDRNLYLLRNEDYLA